MTSDYHYSTLPEGNTRLLRLLPHGGDKYALIECELLHYSLLDQDDGPGLYEALSYAWGSSDKPERICVDNHNVPVTASLHAALHSLRNRSLPRIIWADAICIDQVNTEELNKQVQMMALIYAKAASVIVWLGNATVDSDQAIEHIRVASKGKPGQLLNPTARFDTSDVRALLQRSWFERVWVSQEVAAARHVLVMCGSAQIEGQTFCSGLASLNAAYLNRYDMISHLTYLIQESTSRPKSIRGRLEGFTLGIRPLADLIAMFHTRQATDRRDKIYALLGMRSDHSGERDLMPDYNLSWGELLRQLVTTFFPHCVDITTWESHDIAVVQSKGYVLGHVHSVHPSEHVGERETIIVDTRSRIGGRHKINLTVESTPALIIAGDVICLLDGALKPTIIRLCGDQAVIIRISVDFMGIKVDYDDFVVHSEKFPTLSRSFLLVWDLEKTTTPIERHGDYESLFKVDETFHKSQLALILWDSGSLERAEEIYQELWNISRVKLGWDHPETVAYIRYLALLYRETKNSQFAARFQALARLIPQSSESIEIEQIEQTGVMMEESPRREMMILLLKSWVHKVEFPELVEVSARTRRNGIEVMTSLRNPRIQITTTEEVVLAASNHGKLGKELMQLLLDDDGDGINVTTGLPVSGTMTRHGDSLLIRLFGPSESQNRATKARSPGSSGHQFDRIFILRTYLTENAPLAAPENPRVRRIVELYLYRGHTVLMLTDALFLTIVKHTWGSEVLLRLAEEGYFCRPNGAVARAAVDALGLSEPRKVAYAAEKLLSSAMKELGFLAVPELRIRKDIDALEDLQLSIREGFEKLQDLKRFQKVPHLLDYLT